MASINRGPSGYNGKSPDLAWWLEQIKKGEEFRKKKAYQDEWQKWRCYYRGEWGSNVLPVNLFFTMVRTIVPRVYFRNPTISITPAKPGFLNMAFAKILERADNKMLRQMRAKQHMKRNIQDAFMFGTGFIKLGFGGFHSPTPLVDDENLSDKSGNAVEFVNDIQPNMPWMSRVRPGNIIYPAGLEDHSHTRWIAEKITRPVSEVRSDPRFKNVKDLQGVRHVTNAIEGGHTIEHPVEMVTMYEIRDRKTGKVIVFSPGSSLSSGHAELLTEDDALQQYGRLNYFPLIFNEDDEHVWGVPDSRILEPQQLELNEIRTQIMKHRRISLVKILVKEQGMKPEEAERLVSEDIGAVAWVQGNPDRTVKVMQASTIPVELFRAAEEVLGDVRETVGFSRNQFGEFNSRSGDTTATEANIVRQATEIRVDERRDLAADQLQEIVTHMHGLMFENWGEDEVIDVIGPGGIPIWVQFRGELLRNGRYSVNVDPDSAVPESRELREARALKAYEVLKQNPFIDPIKLTQFLLNELTGVEFDTLMKLMPAPAQLPSGPVPPEQFANILGESFQRLPAQ